MASVRYTAFLQQLWRYNTHAVEMRIDYLNSMTGAGTEAQTVMVNDIPEVHKVEPLGIWVLGLQLLALCYPCRHSREYIAAMAQWILAIPVTQNRQH